MGDIFNVVVLPLHRLFTGRAHVQLLNSDALKEIISKFNSIFNSLFYTQAYIK